MLKVVNQDGFKDLKYYGETVEADSVVYHLHGYILSSPTRTSIQIGPDQHIEDRLGIYINHSCHPTVKVVGNKLISIKQINYGDSITFDYDKTEDKVSHPFICNCCDKLIQGKMGIA